ncbi:MAG: hypothetical protein CVT92_10780 [Bacteroidetes bacterium HGW-Bacteroidetes-1]|jgi:tetratricopeptide (TPR) repeat protein|nr:MAG: hypothetical protein CVT92_10780 [Bacteroidetes bacterium HGW-Bacteroidetes-1]
MNSYFHRIIFLIILLAIVDSATASNFSPYHSDSLITLLSRMEDGDEKVKLLNELAIHLRETDADRALIYCREALSLGNKLQLVESCAITNKIMGEIFEMKHNYQPSINYYLISIKHYKKLSNDLALAQLYNTLGNIYIINHYNYEQGMAYYNLALHHAQIVNAKKEIATAYNSIGGIHYYKKDLDKAFSFFRDALKIREEIADSVDIAASLNNIGEIYRLKGNYSQALDYYNQAMKLNEKYHHHKNLAVNYLNTGLIYSAVSDTHKARQFFLKSIDLNVQSNDTAALIKVMTELGNHYNANNQFDSAITIFQTVNQISEYTFFLEGQRDATYGLSFALEGKGNIRKSFDRYKQYTYLNDSIFAKAKADQMDELHSRLTLDLKEKELELKDNEISLLQREQKLYQFRQLFLWLSLLLVIIATVLVYTKLQSRNKKNKLLLEKEAALHKARQELMTIELKSKHNELTNYALHLIEKNKFLLELKTELKNLRNAPLGNHEERIKEMTVNVQQNINLQKDLEDFQNNIDLVNASFFQNLKQRFPNLTKNEKHLCAMLRLNLSTKEIASLNNVSIRAVEMGRYRLRKKLAMQSDNSLSKFLQEL